MSQQLVDALLFLGLGMFWLLLTVFPQPLLFIWQTEQRRLETGWSPTSRTLLRLRKATSIIALALFGLALYTNLK